MTETKQTPRHSRPRTAGFLRSYRFFSLSWWRLVIVRLRRPFEILLAVCLVLATICFALHALGLLYEGRYSVTRQDYWRIYTLDLRLPFPLNALFKHNDHPVFFPSLVWLPILLWFHNDQTLLFFCGLAITLATLILLLVSLWRSPSLGFLPRLALGLVSTVACLWVGKAGITASGGFSCMNSMATTAVVVGLLELDRLRRATSLAAQVRPFISVVAAGIVASFSFATGLAAWPAFVLLALFYRLRGKIAAGLGASGVITAVIFVLLPNDSKTEIGNGLSHLWSDLPVLAVRFVQVLGAPWVYAFRWPLSQEAGGGIYLAAALTGTFGVLLSLGVMIQRYRTSRIAETAETVAFGMMLFILGSVALIVIGRAGSMAVHPSDALAPRYCFWTPFFWAALAVSALYSWQRLLSFPISLGFLALALPAAALPSQLGMGTAYSGGRWASEDAALRLVCGVEDEASLQRLFLSRLIPTSLIEALAGIYRERGLDMFAWPGAKRVGQIMPAAGIPQLASPRMLGQWKVDRVIPVTVKGEPAAQISGWCLTRDTHRTADYVLFYREDGEIVGLGRLMLDKPEQNRKYGLSARHILGFRGYIKNYSSTQHYYCRPAVDGELVSQNLRRVGLDS